MHINEMHERFAGSRPLHAAIEPLKVVTALLLTLNPLSTVRFHPQQLELLHSKESHKPPVGVRDRYISMQDDMDTAGRKASGGDTVAVQYRAILEDGSVIDSREEAIFEIGRGRVVAGFEKGVIGMEVGEELTITVPPELAYGMTREDLLLTIPAAGLPKGLEVGMQVTLKGAGQDIPVRVSKVNDDGSAVVDANHHLAGKTLTFEIKLLGFRDIERGVTIQGWRETALDVPDAISNGDVKQTKESEWPIAWPYSDDDFRRQDESDDVNFYSEPRFVAHIDEKFIATIKNFYALQFSLAPEGEYSVLDMCSSWISHYPDDLKAKRVAITGMEDSELQKNSQATEYVAKDLNKDPSLPYGNDEFDFITNVVSVDYLTKPREIFAEMHRVMKPGGVAIMSFSNRCFPTKAINMWIRDMNDGPGHCKIVGNYFRFNPVGGWREITAIDLSPDPGNSDPVWVVTAIKV